VNPGEILQKVTQGLEAQNYDFNYDHSTFAHETKGFRSTGECHMYRTRNGAQTILATNILFPRPKKSRHCYTFCFLS